MANELISNTCPGSVPCVIEYDNSDPVNLPLIRYIRKCRYHNAMSDEDAYAEFQKSHAAKAVYIKAVRRALYGTDELKTLGWSDEDPRWETRWATFDESPTQRTVELDARDMSPADKVEVRNELVKITRTAVDVDVRFEGTIVTRPASGLSDGR